MEGHAVAPPNAEQELVLAPVSMIDDGVQQPPSVTATAPRRCKVRHLDPVAAIASPAPRDGEPSSCGNHRCNCEDCRQGEPEQSSAQRESARSDRHGHRGPCDQDKQHHQAEPARPRRWDSAERTDRSSRHDQPAGGDQMEQ